MPDSHISLPDRAKLEEYYCSMKPVYEEILRTVVNDLWNVLVDSGTKANIKHRVKSFDSYFKKLLRRLQNHECTEPYEITDILGVRIISPFIADVESIEKIIRKSFDIAEIEHKGIDHSFREFGYKSTHLLMKIPGSVENASSVHGELFCEIQLLTTLQDAWAEVEHELVYKAEMSTFDMPLKRKLAALNANLTLADIMFQEIREYHKEMESELKRRRMSLFEKTGITEDEADSAKETDTGEASLTVDMISSSEETFDVLLLKAIAAHNENRYHTAIDIYSRLIKSQSSNQIKTVIYNHRGLAYFAQLDYGKAVDDFSRAVECDADNFRAFNYRGMAYRMMGEFHKAIDDLNESLRINPYQTESYYSRALIYYDLGDFPRALEDCEKALNFDPGSELIKKFRKMVKKKMFY